MKSSHHLTHETSRVFTQTQCFLIFLLLLIPAFYGSFLLSHSHQFLFHLMLFFTGWVSWTFLEYIAHRFWMHPRQGKNKEGSFSVHMNHHKHPTDIKITRAQRMFLLAGNILLIAASYRFDNYFTLITGCFFGFLLYCFMHVWLHERWSQKIFPNLHRFHIYHHCQSPHHCFGISVPWWDFIFRTTPLENKRPSERIVEFYFGTKKMKV